MGKSRATDLTEAHSTPDASSMSWINRYKQAAADRYAQQNQAPTSGPLADYAGYAQQMAGNLGFGMERGLGGINAYQDPYQQQVIDTSQADFARQRDLAMNAGADQATRAGAFGGSRQAVLQSGLIGDVNRNEASTLANLRSTGFNQSAARLQADRDRAAALGTRGAEGLLGYGQYLDTRGQNALQGMQAGLGYGGQHYGSKTTKYAASNNPQDLLSLAIQLGALAA